MIRSSVTISLVPQVRGGPFIFWDDLHLGCHHAARFGFHGVEIFAPSGSFLPATELSRILDGFGLKLAAMGTGAGWALHRLTLTCDDLKLREKARDYIRGIIDLAGSVGAPAIIGSMQGRYDDDDVTKDQALGHLAGALDALGEYARQYNVPLLFEPINRYETNLVNTLDQGLQILSKLETDNVLLLADLFHMNIEEKDTPDALRSVKNKLGHVHLADSNRRPAGMGHTAFTPIAVALRSLEYTGYVSAEALPYPDSESAAEATMAVYKEYFAA